MEQEGKGIKEKLVDMPLLGWFFQVVFRTLGIKVDTKRRR